MMQLTTIPRCFRGRSARLTTAMLMLLAAAVGGCKATAGGPSRLQLHSHNGGRIYSQQFSQAYFSETTNGEWEVVLINDGSTKPPAEPGAPLEPDNAAPLRQVVAVRIHWRPPAGVRVDHPSATNSVIDWYVTADSSDPTQDRLHYQGAAFVKIYPDGDVAKVQIRNGQLVLVQSSGSLQDPVGSSSMHGSFVARRNDTMVAAVTAPIRMESLSRVRQAGARQSPAPRNPSGP